jgi:hypothetical protein
VLALTQSQHLNDVEIKEFGVFCNPPVSTIPKKKAATKAKWNVRRFCNRLIDNLDVAQSFALSLAFLKEI